MTDVLQVLGIVLWINLGIVRFTGRTILGQHRHRLQEGTLLW